ncbi:hypothetical protein [Mycolicibacterium iranicum]|nr:hypothetical protein [Mycolicibacterium iranicum]
MASQDSDSAYTDTGRFDGAQSWNIGEANESVRELPASWRQQP